jgi:hypothetical protein
LTTVRPAPSSPIPTAIAALVVGLSLACGGGETAETTPALEGVAPDAPGTPIVDARGQLLAYQGRFATDPLLLPIDVAGIPAADLKRVRAEITARYGRSPGNPELTTYFEAQPWFRGIPNGSDPPLTVNDIANLDLIESFEAPAVDLVAVGELNGTAKLNFTDANTVTIDFTGGLYEDAATTEHWQSRGKWLITWEGSPTWNAAAPPPSARLWEVDVDNKLATLQSGEIKATN